MSIESEARAEAERRWPALNPGDVELTYPRGALRATARKAFEAGAVWASEQADRDLIDAEVEAQRVELAAEIHEAWEFQYDECDHGTYWGGHLSGEPYAMCEITASRIVRRRAYERQSAALLAAQEVRNHE